MKRPTALLLLVSLVPFSLWLVATTGFGPLITVFSDGGWGTQVFLDLICALTMTGVLIHHHARARGINPWPWILSGYLLGSPGPLTYFALYGSKKPLSKD